MNTDPNLLNVKRILDLAAPLSWALLGVAVLGLIGYVVFSGLFGTALEARIPVIVGLVSTNVSAVLQVVFANAAVKAFPAERGLRLKALLGIVAPGLLGVILYGIGSLAVRIVLHEFDSIAQDFVFGWLLIVCVPIAVFLFYAGDKLALVEKRYGIDGATQLYNFQLAAELPHR
ncbi:hypothetical protein [Salinibacterium sp. PAMC 21357]|uniref:hypothetical protein n=1 Tax=Salinibacterium sp. PAMC 21357 TaxID=1112215 RepID=UPI000287CF53|nr:hypothetical protein [Salinibacterium sp. PAMC 21357]